MRERLKCTGANLKIQKPPFFFPPQPCVVCRYFFESYTLNRTSTDQEVDQFPCKECHLKELSGGGGPGEETLPTLRPHGHRSYFYFCHTTQ